MSHKIEISDKTYEYLKEFCRLNDMKIGQYADKLIYDGLMIEMYGDVPFTNYRKLGEIVSVPVPDYKLTVPKEEVEAVTMDPPTGLPAGGVFEVIDKETKAQTNEVKFLEGPPVKEEYIKRKEKLEEKILEELGVPKKVMNRITKRRLK